MTDDPQAVTELERLGAKLRRSKKGSVLIVDFRKCGATVTDDTISLIAKLPKLRELYLEGASVTDEGVAVLATLDQLSTLDLQRTVVTDAIWPFVQKMPKLKLLLLTGAKVTPAAIAAARPHLIGVRVVFV